MSNLGNPSSRHIRIIPDEETPPVAPAEDERTKALVPKEYSLSQNYPNPFNPTTSIKYALPVQSKVKLTIYHILAQAVAQPLNEIQESGFKLIGWNGERLGSSVYFYRLGAVLTFGPSRNVFQVRKMLLVKYYGNECREKVLIFSFCESQNYDDTLSAT